MKKLTVLWAAGIGLLILTLVDHIWAPVGQAFQPDVSLERLTYVAEDGEANGPINQVADLLEKGDVAGAKKAASVVADKNDLDIIMSAFALRKKKGIGVGAPADAIVPDGIEKKLEALVRDGITPAALKKEGSALARAGVVMTAVSYVAQAKAPEKDVGKQKKADFLKWAQDLTKASGEFTAAAKGTSAADFKKAAAKVQQSCDNCHMVFK